MPTITSPLAPIDRAINLGGDGFETFFCARLDQKPFVGELHIRGSLTTTGIEATLADAAELDTLDGLLIVVNSLGGSAKAGQLLEALVLETKQMMPIISYIERAYSAAISPALAATIRLISPSGGLGSIGSAIASCDGFEPSLTVSRQTPEKLAGGPAPWPPWVLSTNKAELQRQMDEAFEREFKMVSFYARQTENDLRGLLAKSHITPDQAAAAGLVDGVMQTEGDALILLQKLAHDRAKTPPPKG